MTVPNVGDLLATTIGDFSDEIADNVTKNNALLMVLKGKGKVDPWTDGEAIFQVLDYLENQSVVWYHGYDRLNIQPSRVHDRAEYEIKQTAAAVTMTGLEKAQNAGKSRMKPLMKGRVKNVMSTMSNNIGDSLFNGGAEERQKEIDGLVLQVARNPATGLIGNIERSNFPFWRNKSYSCLLYTSPSPRDS